MMKENKCKVLDNEQIQRQQRRHDDKEEAYKFCSKDLKRRNSPDTTVTDQDRRGRKSSNPIRRWTDKSSSSTTTTTAVPAANIGPTGIAVDGENNTSTTIQSGRQIQTVLPEKKRSTQDITLRIQKAEGKAPPPKKNIDFSVNDSRPTTHIISSEKIIISTTDADDNILMTPLLLPVRTTNEKAAFPRKRATGIRTPEGRRSPNDIINNASEQEQVPTRDNTRKISLAKMNILSETNTNTNTKSANKGDTSAANMELMSRQTELQKE